MFASLGLSLILYICQKRGLRCLQTSVGQMLIGMTWVLTSILVAAIYADDALSARLKLRSSATVAVTAMIYVDRIAQNSQLDLNRWQQQVWVLDQAAVPIQWRLSYPVHASVTPQLGHYYRITGRLKAAQSYAVPGVFDQERWWLQQNIMGSMQVETIQELSPTERSQFGHADFVRQQQSLLSQLGLSVEKQRLHFRELIAAQRYHNAGLLLALLSGDESLLSNETQQLFQRLGISHLLAISGPHVLIFAMIMGLILRQLTHWLYPQLLLRIARPYLLVVPFFLCVCLYAALVGFEIPARRTLLSVGLVSVLLLLKQALQPFSLVLMSASLLLLFDPFSLLSAAFWLSYGACFILLRVYQSLQVQRADHEFVYRWWRSVISLFALLIVSQWKIFIALMPLILLMFHQVSGLAPVANFIAVPLIGSVIVPIEVLAGCLSLFFPKLAVVLWHLADRVLSALVLVLERLDQHFQSGLQFIALSPWQIVGFSLIVAMLMLPRGILPRAWLLLCGIAMIFSHQSDADFELNILDVGQGQAVYLVAAQHKIMIDVGGKYNEKVWGIADQVVIPYLMNRGISGLDQVILSHLDQDHSGAFERISQVVKIRQLYSSEYASHFKAFDFDYCHAGQQWRYGGVSIQVLAPQTTQLSAAHQDRNEHSCVVYIQVPQAEHYQNFLIMGDAGWKTEYQLLQQYPDLKVDVLLLGHHGSRHSSSLAFLKQLQPKFAIVSAGQDNRYGHPNPIVLARLKALNIPLLSTIEQGMVQFYLDRQQMKLSVYRDRRRWLKR